MGEGILYGKIQRGGWNGDDAAIINTIIILILEKPPFVKCSIFNTQFFNAQLKIEY
jgi:hypothetical protein